MRKPTKTPKVQQPYMCLTVYIKQDEHLDDNGKLDNDAYNMAKFAWKEDYKAMRARKDIYKDNESIGWALVYDQCMPELMNKLEGTSGYDSAKKDDVVEFLIMIRGYCCQFDSLYDEYLSIVGAIKILLYYFQKPIQSNSDYHEDFMAMVEVIEEYEGPGSLTFWSSRQCVSS
jgi:hypothetical protein